MPSRIHEKRSTNRHTIVKMSKAKNREKNLESSNKKDITYKGTPIRLRANFFPRNNGY